MDIRGNKPVDYEFAAEIANKILARFQDGEFDVATLFYAQFKSVISQIPTAQRLIPAELPEAGEAPGAAGNAALALSVARVKSGTSTATSTSGCRPGWTVRQAWSHSSNQEAVKPP